VLLAGEGTDFVVVDGCSAEAVIATHRSGDSARRVALLEAGVVLVTAGKASGGSVFPAVLRQRAVVDGSGVVAGNADE
jgi:hypothetical protein